MEMCSCYQTSAPPVPPSSKHGCKGVPNLGRTGASAGPGSWIRSSQRSHQKGSDHRIFVWSSVIFSSFLSFCDIIDFWVIFTEISLTIWHLVELLGGVSSKLVTHKFREHVSLPKQLVCNYSITIRLYNLRVWNILQLSYIFFFPDLVLVVLDSGWKPPWLRANPWQRCSNGAPGVEIKWGNT